MDWLIENKEWIFSGIGVAIIPFCIKGVNCLLRRRRKWDGNGEEPDDLLLAPYSLQQADEDDIRWIALKAVDLYDKKDSVPEDVKMAWFKKNPKGFWVIKNRLGGRMGSFELLPIKRIAIEQMKNKTMRERDKETDHIYSSENNKKADCVYIENLMAINNDNIPNQWAFRECLLSVKDIVKEMGLTIDRVKVYAMPVREFNTEKGKRCSSSEKLLQKLGFWKIAKRTKQGYPLYCAELSDILSLPLFTPKRAKKGVRNLKSDQER